MAQSLSTASSSHDFQAKTPSRPIRQMNQLSLGDLPQPLPTSRNGHLNLNTFSPVNEHGSFEFDRVFKRGKVFCKIRSRHAFKASWKPCYLVLRPNLLSVYKDEDEAKLLLSITLTEVTAIAPVSSTRHPRDFTWSVFTPSKNYRFQSVSDQDAEDWFERIRSELHVDEEEEAIIAESKSRPAPNSSALSDPDDQLGVITASELSDFGETEQQQQQQQPPPPRVTSPTLELSQTQSRGRNLPFIQEYSGNDMTEFSDLSDGPDSQARAQQQQRLSKHKAGGASASNAATNASDQSHRAPLARESASSGPLSDPDRVIYQGYLQVLRSKRGVRQWKKLWVVLRPISLALYKDDKEYCATRIIPMSQVITAAEIDPISRSKSFCLQIITDDRPSYRCCAPDEESLAKWLGALKSIIAARRKALEKGKAAGVPVPTIVATTPETFQPLR
ncbi:uncharacterized protein TRUGW13939_05696 [Talaromyces rugulosus]|uniref:PH domain-containing protein n=1 Tax=Talaromyces rugulosus TaxID=121627 RepID=A0A7H8QYS1_TALRU|nr:uncharacterized protein TRUGW13939_05696 [Talaromyces rugulosus]QKX58571.1 hypothetical protein TRUGW13939_05696 [Talaromyces rugulosus]